MLIKIYIWNINLFPIGEIKKIFYNHYPIFQNTRIYIYYFLQILVMYFPYYYIYIYSIIKIPQINIYKLLSKETFKPWTWIDFCNAANNNNQIDDIYHFHRFHFPSLSIDLSNDEGPQSPILMQATRLHLSRDNRGTIVAHEKCSTSKETPEVSSPVNALCPSNKGAILYAWTRTATFWTMFSREFSPLSSVK